MSPRGHFRWIALLVLGLAAPAGHAHPPSITTDAAAKATAEEIVAFRKAIVDAIVARDAAKLRAFYTESFAHTHGSGKVDGRDARIVAVLAGDPVIEMAAADDLVVRVPNDWTAIATGASPIKLLADGKTYSTRWTAVYVRTEKGWALAASHATRLGEVRP